MTDSESQGPAEFGEITRVLKELKVGDKSAIADLYDLVLTDMTQNAKRLLLNESSACTLETTDLVHESLIRTAFQPGIEWSHRGHFFTAVGKAMRRILVDAARKRDAQKRGGGRQRVDLESSIAIYKQDPSLLLTIDDAVREFEELEPRAARVLHIHFFAERTLADTAKCLGISLRTVARDWDFAKAWLGRAIFA